MPVGTSAMVALANITLGSSAASVTFSSISGSYRDLVLVYSPIGSTSTESLIRFNGDTTTNISFVYMLGDGSSASSSSQTNAGLTTGGALNTSSSTHVFNVMDYSATDKHKTAISRHGQASANTQAIAHRWASTSAVTSILIWPASGNYAAGSTFSLYGVSA